MPVAGVFPTVARDFVSAPDAARRENDCFRAKNQEPAALAIVTESAYNAVAFLEQRQNRALHVDIDPLMNAVILERPDHFQSGAIADVCEPRVTMSAKVSLQNAAVFCPGENGAPRFQLADTIRRLLRVELRHSPIVDVLPPAHRVGEVHAPVVPVVDIGEGGGDSAF